MHHRFYHIYTYIPIAATDGSTSVARTVQKGNFNVYSTGFPNRRKGLTVCLDVVLKKNGTATTTRVAYLCRQVIQKCRLAEVPPNLDGSHFFSLVPYSDIALHLVDIFDSAKPGKILVVALCVGCPKVDGVLLQ